MFVAIIFVLVLVFSFFFLLLPLVQGEAWFTIKESTVSPITEEAKNLRQSLEDVENEFQIGKISEQDYLRLKKEILAEWQKIYQKE